MKEVKIILKGGTNLFGWLSEANPSGSYYNPTGNPVLWDKFIVLYHYGDVKSGIKFRTNISQIDYIEYI